MLPWVPVDAVLVATASGLLVWAGAHKLRSGRPPAGLPARLARPFGLVELAAGLAGLTVSGRAGAVPVCVLYLLFGAVVTRALVRGATAGCGCLGGDERPDRVHLVVDLIAAAAAAGAFARPGPDLFQRLQSGTATAATLAVLVCCAVACTALVLGHLDRSLTAYRPERA